MSIRFPFDVDVDAVADVDVQLEVSGPPSGLPSARISSRDKTSSWKRSDERLRNVEEKFAEKLRK